VSSGGARSAGATHACCRPADPHDLAIALIAAAGSDYDALAADYIVGRTLGIYLGHVDGPVVEQPAIAALMAQGLVRRSAMGQAHMQGQFRLTANGRRHYVQAVIPRLGLCPPATILAATNNESPLFDDLGLTPELADNLRYRWEEAQRCVGARAWLAASALYGSILEVVLLGWLKQEARRAIDARGAPRDRVTQKPLALEQWKLADLINVAADLDLIDRSHARHASALRESRNLIHPHKQIQERSNPDGHLADIARLVVLAVIEARRRHAGAFA
jgi:hypothetical protein